ncbi:Glycerol-3-phosphate dehydrogenase [Labeo rohita]|uniref:Glycerol-3-phosphate dehydrogenase n=1 Tax=Labeo rohita TaxID=84645 RepID=A0ABQ8LKE9_LABRO|nr:Glycerol-3-phosphate dehydrogenase [Labeo rohita]
MSEIETFLKDYSLDIEDPAAPPATVQAAVQATSSGIIIPRRSTKADLLNLYASLQAGENPNSTPPSRASSRACMGRSAPYSQPEQTTTFTRSAFRPSGCSKRPSASLGHAPNAAVASHHPPPRSSERELAAHAGGELAIAFTSRHSSAPFPSLPSAFFGSAPLA